MSSSSASSAPAHPEPTSPAPAYKEWAVIVRALLAGEQIVDVRKGGLHEDGRHFGLAATRLWLYPTYEHQRAELVKPAYRRWVQEGSDDGAVRLEGFADVVGVATVTDPALLAALDGRLVWTADYAESRLRWKRNDPLWILALRVHRLRAPVVVPYRDEYGGCTSWVQLRDVAVDPGALPSEPALSDVAFEARLKGLRDALPDGLRPPS